MSEYTQISHDGFARQSVVRETIKTSHPCRWCGGNHRGRLFRYGTQPDDRPGRVNWHKGEFCSKSCHDTYHDLA